MLTSVLMGGASAQHPSGTRNTNVSDVLREESAKPDSEDLTTRQKIFLLFDDPTSSKPALAITVWILALTCFSSITFCLETLPSLASTSDTVWYNMEIVVVCFFTFDYLVRILTVPRRFFWQYIRQFMNVIDLVAIMPFYLELVLSGSGLSLGGLIVIRIVRLTRVFRLLKLSRYSRGFHLVSRALARSRDALALLVFLITLALVFFSSALFFAEQSHEEYDEERGLWIYTGDYAEHGVSPFQSIPHSFWWCAASITTTGFGDEVPVTPWGKVVGVFTLLTGILVIAFPITVLSANFAEVWEQDRLRQNRDDSVAIAELDTAAISGEALVTRLQTHNDALDGMLRQLEDTLERARADHERVNQLLAALGKSLVEVGPEAILAARAGVMASTAAEVLSAEASQPVPEVVEMDTMDTAGGGGGEAPPLDEVR